jgi:hypothetical protein
MKLENNNTDFEKGIENGLDQIEKSSYESFVSNEVSLHWLLENKDILEKELNENKFQIAESKSKNIELESQKLDVKNIFENHKFDIEKLENEVEINQARVVTLHEKKDSEKTPYPFLAGFIYLVAGITFILGDLIISHEIVAYALNIRNNTEAWAFACGLAGVSILMKPAYERLVEQPYLNNFNLNTKKIHNVFQIGLVVISIGTLAILGWFRYEAYKTDRLKEAINREIKSLQAEATPLISNGPVVENTALTQRIEEKLKAYDALNQKLVNSPWALLSFVLSGLLFAIAGAVCLGIAFPSLQIYWKRWFQYIPAINKSKRIIRKRSRLISKLKKPWVEADNQIKLIDQKINLLPDFKSLENRNKSIKEEIWQLNEKIKFEIESARVNNYTEGYDTGHQNRNNLSDSELAEFRKNLLDKLKYRRDELAEKTPRTYRSNGLRPHQALRKAISDEFNEN